MFNKTSLAYYRQRKVSNFLGVKDDIINIHKVINSQCGYDPHNMRKQGTRRHNSLSLFCSYYRYYKKGRYTLREFKLKLYDRKDLRKFIVRF